MVVLELAVAGGLFLGGSVWEYTERSFGSSSETNEKATPSDGGGNENVSTRSLPTTTSSSSEFQPMSIPQFDTGLPLTPEQIEAQQKAIRLQRLLNHAADTEKDKQNERILQEMRDAQDARFKQEEEDARLAEQEAARLKAQQEEEERKKAEEERKKAEEEMRQLEELRKKAERQKILKENIRKSQQVLLLKDQAARLKLLQEARKRDTLVLSFKLTQLKSITGSFTTSVPFANNVPFSSTVPLTKISPFFEIDRVDLQNLDKKGKPMTEFAFRSDYIPNSDNPRWDSVLLDVGRMCDNDKDLPIILRVKDYVENGNHIFIGEVQTTFNELLNASTTADGGDESSKVIKLKKDLKTSAKIVITSASIERFLPPKKPVKGMMKLNLKGEKLKNFDGVISKSDPFFELSRIDKNIGKSVLVYRSPYIKNNLWPDWKECKIRMGDLFPAGIDGQTMRFDVYDYESNGTHEFMGGFEAVMDDLVNASETDVPFKMKTQKGESTGDIFIEEIEVDPDDDDEDE